MVDNTRNLSKMILKCIRLRKHYANFLVSNIMINGSNFWKAYETVNAKYSEYFITY